MANETTCLKCGTPLTGDARGGFCPKCLFAQASAGDSEDLSHASDLEPSGTSAAPAPVSGDCVSTSNFTALALPRRFGDYELLEEIARGGMGIVYKARHLSLDRIVAVKMLLFGPLASPEFVKRFRAEASAAASLQHPNIVAIHEVGVHQGQHYFAMDHVEGQSLAKLNAECQVRNAEWLRRAASYLRTVAEAIHYAHERGILHRDLKPSNVLIDANDQPRVTDFGLARRLEGDSELTVTSQVLGSPNYMPPEQAVGRRGKVSRRSDVYSIGAMMYHLLTGRPPFVGEALTDTLEQVLNTEPVSPRLLNPSVPRDLETVCLKCLEKEPDKRYATAQELASDLARFLNSEPVHARPVTRAERVWRWCRRKPALASFVGASALLLLAILIGSPIAIYRIDQARKADEIRNPKSGSQNADRPSTINSQLSTDLRGWEWRYLWKQCQGDQRFILGYHSNGVTAVGFLPDGKAAFSAGNDKVVRLWDLESRQQIGLLPHEYGVSGAACSPDGRWLATGSARGDVAGPLRLWDLATQQEVTVLTTNFWLRPTIVFSPNSELLAFVDFYRGVRLWSISAGQEITNLPAYFPYQSPLGVTFSPDGQTLAYNENQAGDIILWDIRSRSVVQRLNGHQWCVTALAFTPDGRFLASGSMDRTVHLWDLTEGRESVTFTNYTDRLTGLAFSPDGKTLATASGQQLTLLDITSHTEVSQLRGHQSRVTGLAFSPDGQSLITGGGFNMGTPGGDGTVRVWDVTARPKETENRRFHTGLNDYGGGSGPALSLSPDGRHLLSVFTDNTFSVWEMLTLTESPRRPLPLTKLACAALAAGGRLVAFVAEDGNVVFWHSDSNQTNWFARPTTNTSNRAVFSLDGIRLALGAELGEVCVCDVTGRTKLHRFRNDGHVVMSLAFAKDGQKLMAGFHSGQVKVWDLSGHNGELTFQRHNMQVRGLALLPDGRTLVSAGTDVRFWDLSSQRELIRIEPRFTRFLGCSISPDGRRLAVGAVDGLITIWDLASRQEVATLKGHDRHVQEVAFLSDGNTLASVGLDQVRVWRAASLEETDRAALK